MTTLPLMDCCAMLGIDPKTLRHWLKLAQLEFISHPTDARLKCLTMEQVHHMARLHGRPLPSPVSATPALPEGVPALASSARPTSPKQTSEAVAVQAPRPLSTSFPQEADLIQKLSCLERSVTAMQEQLAQLALELLHERELRYERRLLALEALMQQSVATSTSPRDPQAPGAGDQQQAGSNQERRLHPAELRARSRVIPLIEYGAAGTYVLICPQQGALPLTPDSPEWFDWLATLSSFRFVGQQGRLSACRKSSTSRG
jgi:hypothetical protein